jgi:hypothetical protein
VPRRIHAEVPGKLAEGARCPGCGASYRAGRWTWKSAPPVAYEHRCPACEAIATDYPAGVLHVGGDFAAAHRDELIALLRHVEERERADHPLKRIMSIEDEGSGFLVKTTDAKLVDALGRALKKAYAGRLVHPRTTAEKPNLVRVHWTRD